MNIDTIVLKYCRYIDKRDLRLWEKNEHTKPNGSWYVTYVLNTTLQNGAEIKCTYHPHPGRNKPVLLVEFSLPKVILGKNYPGITDLPKAILKINHILSRINGLPSINVEKGILYRVDVYYDHNVGDLVHHYIKALTPLEHKYRKTKPYTSEGVQYLNGQVCSKFYDKEKESDDAENYGILRQEITLRSKKIKKVTGKKSPTIHTLSIELQRKILEDDLRDLNLYERSIGTADLTLRKLCENYGELAGFYYFGLLHANVKLGKSIILASSKSHPRSLDRRLQKIVDAGLPKTLTQHTLPLPPLVINL